MSETELERVIRALVARKNATEFDSAEWRFYERQLAGLRWSCEAAGGIIEDLDPFWGGSWARP